MNECWSLFAVDYNEDQEPYVYWVAGLIRRGIRFLVSPGVVENLQYTELRWPEGNAAYKTEMERRFRAAKEIRAVTTTNYKQP